MELPRKGDYPTPILPRARGRPKTTLLDNIKTWTGRPVAHLLGLWRTERLDEEEE